MANPPHVGMVFGKSLLSIKRIIFFCSLKFLPNNALRNGSGPYVLIIASEKLVMVVILCWFVVLIKIE